ncbi:MAG TPA: apolipoprotein N-acyltransferase [Pyrinomonadaceae bacterium]|jgi:apolipoprotein N-acyltransferase|nr:apolipoprotein N-acyltransferase [Pyrinomonadaceae bacterium]
MSDAISVEVPGRERLHARWLESARVHAPTLSQVGLAALSALMLIISFPDFNLWPLAWVALVPLLISIARRPQSVPAFIHGLMMGAVFFLGSCYWLTYAMVRYGGIPAPLAYLLLVPGALVLGLFPATFALVLARAVVRWGRGALLVAPFVWTALEWARLGVTGQLWNAVGYSQSYHPALIQAARWGGVYAVGFLILTVNASVAYAILQRNARSLAVAAAALLFVSALIALSLYTQTTLREDARPPQTVVVGLQPDVPMEPVESTAEMEALMTRHLRMSEEALRSWEEGAVEDDGATVVFDEGRKRALAQARRETARVVVWPESPMNFTYARDTEFRETVAAFTAKNRTAVLFNSLEPAPAAGAYNAAIMVNEEGRVVAQYDKIRLLPFGEYVPLPRWLPGVSLVPVMVGDFTPGARYPLMPLGEARAGVFICFESAFPSIARRFADEGADVLINISNDGYLGPTPVMRQHLANAVFRAVENGRPVLRVTNTGITARINERGEVADMTRGFEPAVRIWTVGRAATGKTFYTRYGELFVYACAALSLLMVGASLGKRRGAHSAVAQSVEEISSGEDQ